MKPNPFAMKTTRFLALLLLAHLAVAAEVDPARRADFLRRAANIEASGSSAF